MSLIDFSSITKTYSTHFPHVQKKIALDDFNLQIEQGEVFGIVGPNGAGKSTLLKILMGFIYPDLGEISIDEHLAGTLASRKLVGYLAESPCLYNHLSITEHLVFAAKIANIASQELHTRILNALVLVKLSHVATTPLRRFSKGMVQRAALAYALLTEPQILILDEPMSGLDPMGRQLVVDIMRQFHLKGATILFCSHILTDVERICTRIGIMNKGELVKVTTPEELAQDYADRPVHLTPLEACFFETITPRT